MYIDSGDFRFQLFPPQRLAVVMCDMMHVFMYEFQLCGTCGYSMRSKVFSKRSLLLALKDVVFLALPRCRLILSGRWSFLAGIFTIHSNSPSTGTQCTCLLLI